jgi:aclacinomycin oxidase
MDKVVRGDPRYADLAHRSLVGRVIGDPDCVYVTRNAAEVAAALRDALANGLSVAARSGGQCWETFVVDPGVKAVIDTSMMTNIDYDSERQAFVVDCGATLGELYRKLFVGWGVMLPAGVSPDVGVGGHILGGGYGFFARQHGLAVDHLHAVEVVTVDAAGAVNIVHASREPTDPNRDLWWAHTGGGGGNFGIVTRYWLRSPAVDGQDPLTALPKPPASILRFRASWDWAAIDADRFARLVRNHGAWCEANAAPGASGTQLYSTLSMPRREMGKIVLRGLCMAEDGADKMVAAHLAALDDGVDLISPLQSDRPTWLSFVLYPQPELAKTGPSRLFKNKDAFLRRRLTERQIAVAHDYLTRPLDRPIGGSIGLGAYGGAVNLVDPAATASAHRDCVGSMICATSWTDPADGPAHLDWIRNLYADLFAETGGAPVPGEAAGGSFINHPDTDMADPAWNRSNAPWHALYYRDNYPLLQRVKAAWDPLNVFRHALSIRAD